MAGPGSPIRTRALYGALIFVYLSCFPYHPALRSPNELCRLWQSRALIEDGTISINGALHRYGYVGDLSVKDGIYYPSKAPLLAFAAAPIYAGLKFWFGPDRVVPEVVQVFWSRLLLTVLPSLVMLIYLRRYLLAHVSPATADRVVLTYALGSLALNFTWMFVSHQTTSVLVFAAFYALWRLHERTLRPAGYFPVGVFAGAAVASEYTAALPLIALAMYALIGEWRASAGSAPARAAGLFRASLLATLGAAPFIVGLLAYHQAAFGHPLESGYKYLADVPYQGWHVGGFLGIRLPSPSDFARSFVSPLRGLFTISPWLLLAVPGYVLLVRRAHARNAPLLLLHGLLLVGYAYFTASFSYESWGWTAGPRHMTPWLPFLSLPVALLLESRMRLSSAPGHEGVQSPPPFRLGVGVGLCALSIATAGAVAMVNYIPDTLSTAWFGAVLPLLRDGYFPVTLPALFGVPQTTAGVLVLSVILVIAAWLWGDVLFSLRQGRLRYMLASLLVGAVYFGMLSQARVHPRRDREALELLRQSWWWADPQVVPARSRSIRAANSRP